MEYRRGELARREVINVGKFRLKDLAQEKGLTQEELAQRSGVTISTVRRVWQNKGADDPRVGTLRALAQVLGVTVEDLCLLTFGAEYRWNDRTSVLSGLR